MPKKSASLPSARRARLARQARRASPDLACLAFPASLASLALLSFAVSQKCMPSKFRWAEMVFPQPARLKCGVRMAQNGERGVLYHQRYDRILYRMRSFSLGAGRLTGPGPVTWCVSNGAGGYAGVFRVDLPSGGHVRSPCHDASATSWVSAHFISSRTTESSSIRQRKRVTHLNKKASVTPSGRHSARCRFRKDR